MGLRQTVASLFDPPTLGFCQCDDCGRRFEDVHSACPECGGEIDGDAVPEVPAYYWDRT